MAVLATACSKSDEPGGRVEPGTSHDVLPERVIAVMTVFNRAEKTLACLDALAHQDTADRNVAVRVVVVDDGSTDGTSDRIAAEHPDVEVLQGGGDLFWNNGMRRGVAHAMQQEFDHLLWLNDDTIIDEHALLTLLRVEQQVRASIGSSPIVVGCARDPRSGRLTYGGRRRPSRLRRAHFELMEEVQQPTPAETFNGNMVLVPREVASAVGNLDGSFRHAFGDEDYGLRARKAGYEVWLAPGTVGTCARNAPAVYGERPFLDDLRGLWGIKGLDASSWAVFTRRWAGPVWPAFFLSPYIRRAGRVFLAHARRARGASAS